MSFCGVRIRKGAVRSCMHEGFAAAYFLGILLFVSGVIAAVSAASVSSFRAMIHLKDALPYEMAESGVLQDLKCMLRNEEEISGSYQSGNVSWTGETADSVIYVSICSPVEEELEVVYDPGTKTIMEFTCMRNIAESSLY